MEQLMSYSAGLFKLVATARARAAR
jgi:hypothetical protein